MKIHVYKTHTKWNTQTGNPPWRSWQFYRRDRYVSHTSGYSGDLKWAFIVFPETQCLHVQKRPNLLADDTFHPLIHTLTGFLKESTERKLESVLWKQAYFLHQLPVLVIFLFIFEAKTPIWIKLNNFQFGPSFSILCLWDCLLICYNSRAISRYTC